MTNEWRCPECETINDSNTCIVCGHAKSDVDENTLSSLAEQIRQAKHNVKIQTSLAERNDSNFDMQTPLNTQNTSVIDSENDVLSAGNKKIAKRILNLVIVFIWVLVAVIIILTVAFFLKKEQPADNADNTIPYSNAKLIFSNALTYCTQCKDNGIPVSDGWYTGDLSTKLADFEYNGLPDDFDEYLSYMVGGSDDAGFFIINVEDGIPKSAYWNINNTFSEKEEFMGVYPPDEEINTMLSFIENAQTENIEKATEVTIVQPSISETETTTVTTTKDEFNIELFKKEMLNSINGARIAQQKDKLIYNTDLESVANKIAVDIYVGVYKSGTINHYYADKFNHVDSYYEVTFALNDFSSEREAADSLLAYEKENFSSDWLDSNHQYFGVDALINNDGTYCIVFAMADKKITD